MPKETNTSKRVKIVDNKALQQLKEFFGFITDTEAVNHILSTYKDIVLENIDKTNRINRLKNIQN